jgi:ABC-type Zn uptake system ZnuABC Zn-binding protein ZnuA
MKYILIFVLVPVLIYAEKPLNIVTTTTIFQDMIQNIGGSRVNVQSIVPLGSDPHRYEPSPGDVTLCQKADLIMINGLHLEVWIEKLIKNSKAGAETVTITRGITPITGKNKYHDPHAWMNAKNGIRYAENIARAIIAEKPGIKDEIEENLRIYKTSLEELDNYIRQRIREIPVRQRILVTNHDAFQYFGRNYDLQLHPLMGISTEAEAKTSDVVKLIKTIQKTGVPAIFVESSINPQFMQQIARDQGIVIGGSLFSDSLGDKNGPAGTYIGMLKTNTDLIAQALRSFKSEEENSITSSLQQTSVSYGIFILILFLITTFFASKIMHT